MHKKNNDEQKDNEIRSLLERDKSMPQAKGNEWSQIYASLPSDRSTGKFSKLLPVISGSALAFVLVGFLIFPRVDKGPSQNANGAMQEEALLSYLFEDVGAGELTEEELLPGL